MAEVMIKILELINEEYTLDDISLVTGLSYRQIYNYLTIHDTFRCLLQYKLLLLNL